MSNEQGTGIPKSVLACVAELESALLPLIPKYGWLIVTGAVCVTAGAMLAGLRITRRMAVTQVREMLRRIERAAFHDRPTPPPAGEEQGRPLAAVDDNAAAAQEPPLCRRVALLLLCVLLV